MNIQISSHEEIQKAFAEGEYAILALFDKFEAQFKALAEQLEIQAVAITINGVSVQYCLLKVFSN
jgi:hypothetical protein